MAKNWHLAQVFLVSKAKSTGAGGHQVIVGSGHGLRSGGANKRQLCEQYKVNTIRNTDSNTQQGRWHSLHNREGDSDCFR